MGKIEELFLKVKIQHKCLFINVPSAWESQQYLIAGDGQVRTILLSKIPTKLISIRAPLQDFENALVRSRNDIRKVFFTYIIIYI